MNIFYYKIILSFLVGGFWVSLSTIIAEKFSGNIGGYISGLPSTVVITFLFIAWTQGVGEAYDVTTIFPLTFSINAFFLITYVLLSHRGFFYAIFGSLIIWLTIQFIIFKSGPFSFATSITLWAIILFSSYLIMERIIQATVAEKRILQFNNFHILLRMCVSGTVIAGAVIFCKLGGSTIGSIFSSFPAVYISTLLISSKTVNLNFSCFLTKSMLLSGLINCIAFNVAFRYLILDINIIVAAALSYLFSLGSAYITYNFIKSKLG